MHTRQDLALLNAKREVIERDLFLCHFFTQTPFQKIAVSDSWIVQISTDLKSLAISVEFFSMGSINDEEAILCAISGLNCDSPFGYIMGTSAGSRESAVIAAFLEAFRNFAHFDRNGLVNVELFQKRALDGKVTFADHGHLALDPTYATKALRDILCDPDGASIREDFELNWVSQCFDLSTTPFAETPVFVYRATSASLQDLFVGETTAEQLNEQRLRQFCRAHRIEYKLFSMPHPFN